MTNEDWLVDLDACNYAADMAVEHHAYVLDKPVAISLTIAKMLTNITSSDVLTVYNADGYLFAVLKDIKGNLLQVCRYLLILTVLQTTLPMKTVLLKYQPKAWMQTHTQQQ